MIRNEDNFSLQMQTEDGSFHSFEKSGHLRIDRPSHSLMPSNYGSQLGKQDVDDIVAFLLKTSASHVGVPPPNEDE
jgi:hypothetical protein